MKNKPVQLFAVVLAVVVLTALACSTTLPFTAKPTSTATSTPVPTNTETPTPTDTPVPPTATPDVKATQIAEKEQAIKAMLAKMDLPTDTGSLGWTQSGKDMVGMAGPVPLRYKPFAKDLNAGDFVLYMEMTWKTNGWPVCGAAFRSDRAGENGNFYLAEFLRFSGLPAWDIVLFKFGNPVANVTDKVRTSNYLNMDDGATNKIAIAAIGNEFKVFINGSFIGQYYDYSKTLSQGTFAFAGSQASGETTCTFENSWVWVYK